jgi:hypothetical protein
VKRILALIAILALLVAAFPFVPHAQTVADRAPFAVVEAAGYTYAYTSVATAHVRYKGYWGSEEVTCGGGAKPDDGALIFGVGADRQSRGIRMWIWPNESLWFWSAANFIEDSAPVGGWGTPTGRAEPYSACAFLHPLDGDTYRVKFLISVRKDLGGGRYEYNLALVDSGTIVEVTPR